MMTASRLLLVALAAASAVAVLGDRQLCSGGSCYQCQADLNCLSSGPQHCGVGQQPWAQGSYNGCIKCPLGYGTIPVKQGDVSWIKCVKCTDYGIKNCESCCLPNGSQFCGEGYKSYGCCDWCLNDGTWDNPPTHGVCYAAGTSPPASPPILTPARNTGSNTAGK